MVNLIQKKRFISYQVKQALFYSFQEAQKNKKEVLTLDFLFYGLIKTNSSLLNQIIDNLYKKNGHFSGNRKILLHRCEESFKKQQTKNNSNSISIKIALSKPLRNLIYSSIRNAKSTTSSKYNTNNYLLVSTLSIFLALVKNESVKNWLFEEIFLLKK